MADKMYALSETDYQHFREMVQERQRTRANGSQVGLGGQLDEGFQASDVYVARTPSGGIPGLEEFAGTSPDEPGSASCQVYKLAQSQGIGAHKLLKIPGLTKKVFNLTTHDVAGSAWVPILKTKGGPWIVIGDADEAVTSEDTGTGTEADPDNVTGGGECALARLNSDDCLIATGPNGQSVLLRRTGAKTWTSVAEMRYPDGTETGTSLGGSGTLVATWNATTARMDLTLDGSLLQNCGNGCYTGSWLTGHVADLDDATPCNGLAFTICLACACCPATGFTEEGWYCVVTGTGTGTAEGNCEPIYLTVDDACDVEICSGPYATFAEAEAACGEAVSVTTTCNSSYAIPGTLYARLVSGAGVVTQTEFQVRYNAACSNPGSSLYNWHSPQCLTTALGNVQAAMTCTGTTWGFTFGVTLCGWVDCQGGGGAVPTVDSVTYGPFKMTASFFGSIYEITET
jgi:hypothetical protein